MKTFCLETDWTQSTYGIRKESLVRPFLDYMHNQCDVDFVWRQVATPVDFNYYIEHLRNKSYDEYNLVYLCFHGLRSEIHFPNKEFLNILDFAEQNQDIFVGRNVHFGSCSTLDIDEENAKEFKRLTGARMISGYQKTVPFVESFLFEFWLMDAIRRHPDYGSTRLIKLAEKEMSFYVEKLKFIAF